MNVKIKYNCIKIVDAQQSCIKNFKNLMEQALTKLHIDKEQNRNVSRCITDEPTDIYLKQKLSKTYNSYRNLMPSMDRGTK